jgi:hypothetical protein
VSLGVTLATVLVVSRVNPPNPPPLAFPASSGVTDEVLPELRLESLSLPGAAAAINAAAGRERVRLDLSRVEVTELGTGADYPPPKRWRNVRLGTVLAQGGHEAFRAGDLDWREEAGVLVVGRPGPVTCRVYDVSDLAAELRAQVEALRRRPSSGGNICFPRVGPPPPVDEEVSWALGVLVSETIEPGAWQGFRPGWWVVAWGGRLFVQSSETGHRQVEALLELIRRGEPVGPTRPGGGR